ncbi:MAG: histidine--tRNA ligase [Actinobacteria bacterium]|uniref:histidine--tRNA ligase n=1 Tax=freshwater metagenome TaxID=449393 RepID=A0A6J7NVK2_9ZZZZ|nr:histidine--tRNA ligase [Actinomycetota bacterium]
MVRRNPQKAERRGETPVASQAVAEPLLRAPKGTSDLLHPASARFRALGDVFARVANGAGYGQVILPMFEHVEVFHRLGEATDVVTKEMFEFDDRGGRRLALRPEQTASAVRAFVENRPMLPWKAWYAGPNFRAENVQKGRYRQFDQVGVEVLGLDDALIDTEVIALAWDFFRTLGLRDMTLLVNSLGDAGDRARYVDALREYFNSRAAELSEQSRETLARNPLRVLDSKRREDASVVAEAPLLADHLSEAAAEHFARVQDGLRAVGVPFTVSPRLVRGLDYYVRTTFEIQSSALDAAQSAIGGGGRYDGLVEQLGGDPTPGIGFALGVERTLLACDAEGAFTLGETGVDVFVVDTTGGLEALTLTHELRRAGVAADRAFENRSMKSQMKAADRSGARFALLVGTDERDAGEVTLRDLRSDTGQLRVARTDVLDAVKKALA